MRYDPATAKESTGGDIQPGTYSFEVIEAVEGNSKSTGHEMITLKLAAQVTDGEPICIFDYLVNTPGGLWKAKGFCKAVGIDFDSGDLTEGSCMYKQGVAEFAYDLKDVAAKKVDPNKKIYLKVKRYVEASQPAKATTTAAPADEDLSIPF